MGKITPGFKTILVFITFLGFTNFILSETKVNFSGVVFNSISENENTDAGILSSADSAPIKLEGDKTSVFHGETKSSETTSSAPTVTVGTVTNTSCEESSDGAITITVSGGVTPYSIEWTNNDGYTSTSQNISNIQNGTYQVTVSDSDNASTTLSGIIVSIEDNILPQITAPANVIVNTNSGACHATGVNLGSPTASDNCTGYEVINNAPASFPLGNTTVTWTITDASGNKKTAEQTVTVEDNESPTITAPPAVTVNTDTGTCNATGINLGNPVTSDNCTISVEENNAPTSFPIGNTTVTWTVRDNEGNSSSATQIVTVEDKEVPVISPGADITQNNDPGSCYATISVAPATTTDNCSVGAATGTRSDGMTLAEAYPVGTTTITWNVTDEKGNAAAPVTQDVTVVDNEAPALPAVENITWGCSYTVTPPVTTDNCTETITGTTTSPLTYSTAGTYTINWKFTDEHSNTSSIDQTITIAPLQAQAQVTNVLCHGNSTGSITINASGGTGPYTYTWNTLGTGQTKTNLPAGTYHVTVSDVNGCETSLLEVIITEPEAITMTDPTIQEISCYGAGDGSITIGEVTGGTGAYSYKITGASYQTGKTFSNLSPGTYTISIKDANNCIFEEDVILTEPAELLMADNLSITPVSCFGGDDGSVTAGTVSGGNGNYLYSLDNETWTSENAFTGLSAGSHTIFVADSKDCSLQFSINIPEPTELKANVNSTNINCFEGEDGTITLSGVTGGSGNYQYSIDNINWQDTPGFTGLAAGSFSVYIRDAGQTNCVVLLKEIQLTQPSAALETTISTTRTTTYGTSTGTANATPTGGSGGYFYEWRKAGETAILQSTQKASNLPAGDYELTVRDSNGCLVSQNFSIIDKVRSGIISTSLCLTQHDYLRTSTFEVDLVEIAGGFGSPENFLYTWAFGSDASPQTGSGTDEFTVTWGNFGDKVVSLTITDEAGVSETYDYNHYVGACFEGCGETENFDLDINNIYIGDKDGNKMTGYNCDETAEKYLWIDIKKNANGYSLNAELNYAVNDGVQTHSRKAVGCFEEIIGTSGNKNIYSAIPLGLFRLFPVQETGTDGDKITWKCGETLIVEQILIRWTNQETRGCGEGTKPMCYGPDYTIHVNTPLMVTATSTNILCKGINSGSITIDATGGYEPYEYRISGPQNIAYQSGHEFYDLPAGDYNYDVRDAKGIVTSGSLTITEPSTALTANITGIDPICYGGMGQATVIPEGGTPFLDEAGNSYYEYVWNNGQITSTATELVDGLYSVTVRDANECEILKTIEIFEPEQLTTAETGADIFYNCGFRVAELVANTPVRGVGTWTITSTENGGVISDPNNPISTFTGNAGVHTLRWTIANEDGTCETFSEMNVTFSEECSTLDFDGVDDYVFFDDNYDLTSGSFTIEAWVKPNNLGGVKTVLSKRNSLDLSEGGYDLIINSGSPAFRWGASGSVSTSHKLNTDRWYHLAVIFKDNQVKLYVDGINLGTASATNPRDVPHPFLVGAMFKDNKQDKPQNLFNGWIEEVRIWNTSLTQEQLRFLMNQRVKLNSNPLRGNVLPLDVPGTIQWTNLLGYYRMIGETVVDGQTLDEADNKAHGELRNINTTQQNTAPLPYVSVQNGAWRSKDTWLRPTVWDVPNGNGINGSPINWNIARVSNDITSGGRDITMLGLLSESKTLTIADPNAPLDENNPGYGLTITHYLKLDGIINLVGESQLVQTDISTVSPIQTITSVLDETSSGYIERAQQGTANSFNYNYWSSPVSHQGAANNSTYTIKEVMLDGSATTNYGKTLSFEDWHEYADGDYATPRKISNYWIHKFRGTVNLYSEWKHIGSTGVLNAGEGYTMKGTSGKAAISARQNYLFKGKPNNGTIKLNIAAHQNYLLGNPYPSSIDINEFILDNLKDVAGGRNTQNVFNGAVYFWDHFAGGDTHILKEYIGGYATRNLLAAVPAISNDERVNATGDENDKIPGQYIPVSQGFFINTTYDQEDSGASVVSGGDVLFKNSQRAFIRENITDSQFLRPEEEKQKSSIDTRAKIRLDFKSPKKYNRQILVGVDPNTTTGFDLGYDAALNDNNAEDMYWMINTREYIIQGVPDFDLNRVLPLGIKISQEGEFSIRINKLENVADDVNIYLKDKETNSYFNLRKSDYSLNISPGFYHDRFEIVFQTITEEEEEPTPEEEEEDEEIVIIEPGEGGTDDEIKVDPDIYYLTNTSELIVNNPDLQVISQITLHSISGQVIETYENIATQKEIRLPVRGYSSSVYLVKMETEYGVIHKKLIINN